ncbi:hypothetical protein C8J56DRAFT_935772 [Mycena floridula]|nr:hypothetical protein C8J56DRAFT_935772 [Mycena floridula]
MDDFSESVSFDDSDVESLAEPHRPVASASSGIKLVLPSLKSLKAAKAPKKGKSKTKAFKGYSDDPFREKKAPRPLKLKPLKDVLAKLVSQLQKKDDYAFFLKPVEVSKVKRPMDLGTMAIKVQRGRYRSLEDFTNDFRLVTGNAKLFNPPGSLYYVEADRLEVWGLDHISKAASTVIQYETDWNIDIEKDEDFPMEDEEEWVEPSVELDNNTRASSVLSQSIPGRRTTRAALQPKKPENPVATETLDNEGRFPGSKDGLGAFPPGSGWAKVMLSLKLKGKRYKTKKERLRVEKEGPPLAYTELEDPFSILSALVPDRLSKPLLTPLYPPTSSSSLPQPDRNTSETPQPSTSFPRPVAAPLKRPKIATDRSKHSHWTISRGPRPKGKEKDDEDLIDMPAWKTAREPHAVDFGSLALLAGELAEEMARRSGAIEEDEEQAVFETIRNSLEPPTTTTEYSSEYWSNQRAAEAEEYLRDVVYGGVDGYAYVRSLAEFVRKPQGSTSSGSEALGMPLAQWDPLTGSRHTLICKAALALAAQKSSSNKPRIGDDKQSQMISSQVAATLNIYPAASQALLSLMHINSQKIDIGALIKSPDELFLSEEVWAGKGFRKRKRETDGDDIDMEDTKPSREHWYELEAHDELNQVLQYTAEVISNLDAKVRRPKDRVKEEAMDIVTEEDGEDATSRDLRLNLLALAKRAPLDTIARLPIDLVPQHIRHFIPSLGTSS